MIRTDFQYDAWLKRAIDADTLEVFLVQADYGFAEYKMAIRRLRLMGIDCWERRHRVRTASGQERQTFERYVALVWLPLTSALEQAGHQADPAWSDQPHVSLASVLRAEGHEKNS